MFRETVLILDREFHTQWTLKTLLETEEYIAIAVNTREKVLQSFSEFEVSGFITEYWIDHSNSLELVRELNKKFPGLYTMMLTNAEVVESEYEEIIDAGVDDFFLKPISSKRLLLHLKKGLKQRGTLLERNRLEQELKRIHGPEEPGNINAQLINRIG